MSIKCFFGLHQWEYFKKVFKLKGITYRDSIMLRRRKCNVCGKYQGKSMWLRDDWSNLNPNEGDTLVPLQSL